MENIPLPKSIEFKELKENKAQIIIEPLFPGYGITIANPLRRVLLSSLPGSAVTKIKIKDANHEFSTLPHVKEDLVEMVLNIKKLRIKMFGDEPVKLQLSAKGEKIVKAGDIEKNSNVEIVNKDLTIATLTDKKAELDIEFTIERGMGYVSVEDRGDKNNVEPGEVSIDSLFTPIVNVSFGIEEVRVGKVTDYEKLAMKIETDGTINPKEALETSLKIILDHFNFIKSGKNAEDEIEEIPVIEEAVIEEKEVKKEKKEKVTKVESTDAKAMADKKEKKTSKKVKK